MKRTNTTLWSIAIVVLALAVAAGPAAARTEISSSNPAPPTAGESASTASPQTAPVVTQSSGFEWDDALVGALGALGLVSISLVTVFAMRRHHRLTVESRA